MKLWADADVTPTLQYVAHERGYVGTSNRQLGRLFAPDHEFYPDVVDGDWTLITNNEKDFRKLAAAQGLHAGLITLSAGGSPEQQQAWLHEVITYIEQCAAGDGEEPADWMVCRLVHYDAADGSIVWEWIPEDAA